MSLNQKALPRSAGTWVIVGVPAVLLLTLAWQLGSGMLHAGVASGSPMSVSQVSLEADAAGSRIDLVLGDRVGQDTAASGSISVQLREPGGAVWQATRSVTPADFKLLPEGGLLAGRRGYSVVIPASDWLSPPRHGGGASVSVTVQPTTGVPFSTVAEQRFP